MKLQNLVNHVVFVIDESSSMSHLRDDLTNVFDDQIRFLSSRSQELDQETRVSVYKFSYFNRIQCIIYDMDVMRLPSLKGLYQPSGATALLDATGLAITELKLTPEIHGDHAFLVYVLTDGEENDSKRYSHNSIRQTLEGLSDNWSFGIFVPDQQGVTYATRYGFPKDNISVWDTAAVGAIRNVGSKMQQATENFFQARKSGKRVVKNLFQLNDKVSAQQVRGNLDVLPAKDYLVINVRKDGPIKETVETWTGEAYRSGSAYYQLTKKEKVQATKNLLIKDKKNGKVYEGDRARKLLGLPNHEVSVAPAHLAGFDIFVQSTSVNRKLIQGTELIVLK